MGNSIVRSIDESFDKEKETTNLGAALTVKRSLSLLTINSPCFILSDLAIIGANKYIAKPLTISSNKRFAVLELFSD